MRGLSEQKVKWHRAKRQTLYALFAVIVLPLWAGCGIPAELRPVELARYQMFEFQERRIPVRYLDGDGNPRANRPVTFAFEGNENGALIQPVRGTTDSDGITSTLLRAGFVAEFSLVASAPGAESFAFSIVVF